MTKSDWLRAPSYQHQNENPSKRYKLNKKTVYSTTVHAFQTLDDNCDMTLRFGWFITYDSYGLTHVFDHMLYDSLNMTHPKKLHWELLLSAQVNQTQSRLTMISKSTNELFLRISPKIFIKKFSPRFCEKFHWAQQKTLL